MARRLINKMRAEATCGLIGPRLLAVLWRQRSERVRAGVAILAKGLCLGLLTAGLTLHPATAADAVAPLSNPSRALPAHEGATAPSTSSSIETQAGAAHRPQRANFERERASHQARYVADWVVAAGDNHAGDNRSVPFVIVDKTEAKVFVFDADGRLRGAAPALLGLALGDDAVPGIGDRALSSIHPEDRTTPAGRFVAALDRNFRGKEVLWVDYDGAVSIHPVVTTKPKERRLQRLSTATPLDNRISYGCINVPAKFFKNVVRPAFSGTHGIVYVLPETRPAREVFASYDVEERASQQTASQQMPASIAPGAARH